MPPPRTEKSPRWGDFFVAFLALFKIIPYLCSCIGDYALFTHYSRTLHALFTHYSRTIHGQ